MQISRARVCVLLNMCTFFQKLCVTCLVVFDTHSKPIHNLILYLSPSFSYYFAIIN